MKLDPKIAARINRVYQIRSSLSIEVWLNKPKLRRSVLDFRDRKTDLIYHRVFIIMKITTRITNCIAFEMKYSWPTLTGNLVLTPDISNN